MQIFFVKGTKVREDLQCRIDYFENCDRMNTGITWKFTDKKERVMSEKQERVLSQVLDHIRDKICSGVWTAGEKIPSETLLAQEIGVSRASVRSAYQYLAGLGVVASRKGSGTFLVDCQADSWDQARTRITSEDCQNIRQVLEFRRVLEPEACRMAACLGPPDLPEKLERRLADMTQWIETPTRSVPAGIAFHEAIAQASGNPLLEKSLHKVFWETRNSSAQIGLLTDGQAGIQFHTAILRSIRARDGQAAHDEMLAHLENTLRRLQNLCS